MTTPPLPKLGDPRVQEVSEDAQKTVGGLDLNDDTPLAPACDLSGDGSCEACQ